MYFSCEFALRTSTDKLDCKNFILSGIQSSSAIKLKVCTVLTIGLLRHNNRKVTVFYYLGCGIMAYCPTLIVGAVESYVDSGSGYGSAKECGTDESVKLLHKVID